MLRTVAQIHQADSQPMGGLATWRAMPTRTVGQVDPFLFLNHHGPQQYPPNNQGLPFGPHPHRGFETVTVILGGDVVHQDSEGYRSTIGPGGIQWMTAGSGLLHSETSSEEFMKKGGAVEILQLWVNLPARLKMAKPAYHGLQGGEIPVAKADGAEIRVVAGEWPGAKSSRKP